MFIKDDPIDRFSVSGEANFPGQEIVNLDGNIQPPDKEETLCCGKRKIKPRTLLSPKMKGKTHGDKVTTGVASHE